METNKRTVVRLLIRLASKIGVLNGFLYSFEYCNDPHYLKAERKFRRFSARQGPCDRLEEDWTPPISVLEAFEYFMDVLPDIFIA